MGAIQVSGYHTATADSRVGPVTVGGLNFSPSAFGSSQQTQIAVIVAAVVLAVVLIQRGKK